jgi:hypothetical protein
MALRNIGPTKIDQPIVDWHVLKGSGDTAMPPAITFERNSELEGTTYKIKPPTIQCAVYITINHAELPDGTQRPLEMFINSKHTEHHQWIMALTRMISAVFRKPGEIEFAIEELEQVFDPQGGYWYDQEYRPSLVAHVGMILRHHCEKIGAIPPRELVAARTESAEDEVTELLMCSSCKKMAVTIQAGCRVCTNCGESKCE